ncbi:MAG: carbamate kinase [Myxococcota bacterium]|nr:carbamate kinase [Myxococcota bacterium]
MSQIKKEKPIVLVALGGHAFMQRQEKGTVEVHERNAAVICQKLMTLIERQYRLVVTHGNGPQVGNLLLLNETGDPSVPKMPLDVLVAQTEGSLGYFMLQAMLNELRRRGIKRYVTTVVTQVLVDPNDPAFKAPTKPVGPFLSQEEAERRRDTLGWNIVEDAGRGWRRLVPSPKPLKVIQRHMIRESAETGHIVIAAGGGGIPIWEKPDGQYEGTEAVIDKDLSSSMLATQIGAEIFIVLTEVPFIYTGLGTTEQREISAITAEQLQDLHDKGEFPAGSMGPKVESVIGFLNRGGKRAIVTNPDTLPHALEGRGGTHIIGGC